MKVSIIEDVPPLLKFAILCWLMNTMMSSIFDSPISFRMRSFFKQLSRNQKHFYDAKQSTSSQLHFSFETLFSH
ncbi:unnamed protein product [Larinioides sclopetarius]|uniref:ATP synthase F0 subunit 8 n=1 Tax=Larinioides sclopetarius TaxID=280406 RepID=A0AAV1ZCI1_9ARAC